MKISLMGIWEMEIPDDQTPLGIAKGLSETAIITHNQALGEGYKAGAEAFGREFGKAVGEEVGRASADVIRQSAPTPQNLIETASKAGNAGMDVFSELMKYSPMGMMSAFLSAPKSDDPAP